MTTFLFLHGWGGNNPGHWQEVLAQRLRAAGEAVLAPDMPDPDTPRRAEWLARLERELAGVDPSSLVVAGHSLGCALWLHYAARHPDVRPQKLFLVAPPLTDCEIGEIEDFFPLPELDLSAQQDRAVVVGSDNDNFIPQSDFETLAARLGVPFQFIPDAGHFNGPSGYGEWPWLEEQL